ncbi:MAG: glycosyltransferase [Bacteroidales bacterium]
MEDTILSVCLITYNHVKFIREAIEGVLNQEVNFTFELIIADDFSNDGTREILLEYKKQYPDKIKLVLQKTNVGAARNWLDLINAPKSKYIAYFEGDDYWIDSHKLQKQIDFLENNQEFVLCFHDAYVIDVTKKTKPFSNCKKGVYLGEDILRKWLVPTGSIVFRNVVSNRLPSFFANVTHGDLALLLFLSEFGKFKYMPGFYSIYRINSNSITKSIFSGIDHNLKHIRQIDEMQHFFGDKYKKPLLKRKLSYMLSTAILYMKIGKKSDAKMLLKNIKKISPRFLLFNFLSVIKLLCFSLSNKSQI